ncbi:MAG: nucleoside-diphosphate sugar epimerase/dehydratase, partial [Opitutaceae bacterium]
MAPLLARDGPSQRLAPVTRALVLLTLYSACLAASWEFAYLLRFDFAIPDEVHVQLLRLLPWIITIKLLLLLWFRQFASLLSYFSLPDAQRVFLAMFLAAVAAYGLHRFGTERFSPPRSVVLSDFITSFTVLSGLRLALRRFRERFQSGTKSSVPLRRIGIIGAGDVGSGLIKDCLARPTLRMKAIALGDDDRTKWHTSLHGVPVVGSPEYLIANAERLEIDELVIAMPSAPGKRVREIVSLLTTHHLKFEQVPSVEQLVNGNVRVSQLRPVELEDLLGRDPINLQVDRIHHLLAGKAILVTGAGGSIGSELCRQIAAHGPRALLLVERCEFLLFQTEQELRQHGFGAEIFPIVADILDIERMRGIFDHHSPQLVFHAAAHKHVPLMELQPSEALRNNTFGTTQLAELSAAYGVERFVLISTDKAINPTSVMGATKRMAELFLQAFQLERAGATRFMAVRFGNVLGSSGSVIPTFKRQIAAGGPITVTHPDVTRYFMTVNEAVGLVLQAATLGEGGEI